MASLSKARLKLDSLRSKRCQFNSGGSVLASHSSEGRPSFDQSSALVAFSGEVNDPVVVVAPVAEHGFFAVPKVIE